ncbi:MAG: hypothetical protein Q7T86_16640 [Hyphomicrobiaceae bacterium]|nr:hypothetical protein [Hyphomicrobiaceae bacterium]
MEVAKPVADATSAQPHVRRTSSVAFQSPKRGWRNPDKSGGELGAQDSFKWIIEWHDKKMSQLTLGSVVIN